MSALTLRRWAVEEWLGSELAWSRLLARSGADPLFLSWEWLTDWWRSYGGSLGRSPHLAVQRPEGSRPRPSAADRGRSAARARTLRRLLGASYFLSAVGRDEAVIRASIRKDDIWCPRDGS